MLLDTDTAGDDTQAILLAALSDRVDLEGVTICAGNVPFEHQVENAKYTLGLVGADDVPVYEGARSPLCKEYEYAEYVHGEGGLGGDLFPDTGTPSAEEQAVDAIVRTARENPGEITLTCIAPVTNVALALQLEPALPELLDDVWVMGGEHARQRHARSRVQLLGRSGRRPHRPGGVRGDAGRLGGDGTGLAVRRRHVRRDRGDRHATLGVLRHDHGCREGVQQPVGPRLARSRRDAQPDSMTLATLLEPDIVERAGTYSVDVDDRDGITRGYSAVDELGVTDGVARTRVVESVDGDRFERMMLEMVRYGDPHHSERSDATSTDPRRDRYSDDSSGA